MLEYIPNIRPDTDIARHAQYYGPQQTQSFPQLGPTSSRQGPNRRFIRTNRKRDEQLCFERIEPSRPADDHYTHVVLSTIVQRSLHQPLWQDKTRHSQLELIKTVKCI